MILGFEHTVALSVAVKAVGAGYALGLLYSFFMFLNSLWDKNTVSVFLRDVLFFSVAAVVTFLFSLKYNAGIMRFYIFAGELMGFCIFYIFPGVYLGRYFRKTGKQLKNLIKNILCRFRLSFSRIINYIGKKKDKITSVKKKKEKSCRNDRKKTQKTEQNRKKSRKILCFKQKSEKNFVKPLDIKK